MSNEILEKYQHMFFYISLLVLSFGFFASYTSAAPDEFREGFSLLSFCIRFCDANRVEQPHKNMNNIESFSVIAIFSA